MSYETGEHFQFVPATRYTEWLLGTITHAPQSTFPVNISHSEPNGSYCIFAGFTLNVCQKGKSPFDIEGKIVSSQST
ncbi:MAG: hypothetical protein MJZ87_06810 [Bacteroidales bacterium]|nr:hypothetical protein [Bacteroidales bacterium]